MNVFFIKGDNRIYTCIDVSFLDKSISVGQPVAYGIKDNNAIVKLKRIDDGRNSFSLNDQSDEYLNGIRNCFAMDSLDDYDYLVLKFDGVYMRLANMSVGEYFDYIHYIQDGNTSEESIAFIKENWSSDAKYNFTKELEEQLDALEALDDLGNVETWEDLYDWIEEYGEY